MKINQAGSRKLIRKELRLAKKRKPLRANINKVESVASVAKKSSGNSKRIHNEGFKANHGSKAGDQSWQVVDPMQAEIEAEEMEIARLSRLLGMSTDKDKKSVSKKLNKEYEINEGFGSGFGDFLDDLDAIGTREKPVECDSEEEILSESDLALDFKKSRGNAKKRKHSVQDEVEEEIDDEQEKQDESEQEEIDESEDEEEQDEIEDEEEEEQNESESQEESEVEDEQEEQDESEQEEIDESENDEEKDGEQEEEEQYESEEKLVSVGEIYRPVKGEDIYGRSIGQQQEVTSKKYVPPAKRARIESTVAEAAESAPDLRRNVNGLMNRLSDQSKDATVRALKTLFDTNSHTITNNILKDCVMILCANPTQTMDFIIPVYASVIAALHFIVGIDIGAQIVENLTVTFHASVAKEMQSNSILQNKLPNNCLLFLMYLYNLRVMNHTLIFDIMEFLIGTDEHDNSISEVAELLVQIFKHCGTRLRADDPVKLRDLFQSLTKKAKDYDKKNSSGARVQFMIEALTDLKNNKSKRSNIDNENELKLLRRWLGSIKISLGSKASESSILRVSLKDLLNAESRGRWWKAGASWAGVQNTQEITGKDHGKDKVQEQFDKMQDSERQKLLDIANRMKFNTTSRRNIFLVMMSSRDVNDAFERLLRMDFKGKQDREVVRVLVECCGQESTYNGFYSELATLLCTHNRQFRTTVQFSYWDTFKALGNEHVSHRRAINLARMLAHLVCSFQIPLSVLKPLDMTQLSEPSILFLATFFMSLFSTDISEDTFQSILDRVATTKDFSVVREAVLMFLQQHFTEPPKGVLPEKAKQMMKRRKQTISTMEKMSVLEYRGEEAD